MDVLNDPSFLVNEDEMVKEEMIFELTQHFELKNFAIIQTSAKLAQNVNEPFEECVRRIQSGGIDYVKLMQDIIKYDSMVFKHYEENGDKKKCFVM